MSLKTSTLLVMGIDSSNVDQLLYVASKKALVVTFKKGSTYIYKKVGLKKFLALLEADSIGGTLHATISKNPEKYPFAYITPREYIQLKQELGICSPGVA